MSNVVKIVALTLVALAVLLGVLAYRVAMQPAVPAAPAAVSAPVSKPVKTFPVVVASKAIAAGETLSRDMLKIEQWPVAFAQAYTNVDKLPGEIARFDIAQDTPVLSMYLMQGLAAYLQPGERAVAIALDEVSGAANRIQPGDYVDVFIQLNRGEEVGGSQTRLLQSRVRVLAYGLQSVDGPPPGTADKTSPQRNAAPAAARNAIVAVPVEQVNELLLAAKKGALQLALRAPKDEAVADTALFERRVPVLSARTDLSNEQKAELSIGVNRAFAGDSLPQLSGPAPVKEKPATRPRARSSGRSIEVIRGDSAQIVNY